MGTSNIQSEQMILRVICINR